MSPEQALGSAAAAAAIEVADDAVKVILRYEAGLPSYLKALIAAILSFVATQAHLIPGAGVYAMLANAVLAYLLSQVSHKV